MSGPQSPRRVEMVVNPASGGVGPDAASEAERLLAELGVAGRVQAPDPKDIEAALRTAIDAAPDVLVVLAGDGTARAAAELCGPDGPVLVPLPGGTMNMLPYAIYGRTTWPEALRGALTDGEVQPLAGGELEGRLFLVAAVLGAPALWAPAREAMRAGRLSLAWSRARRALNRAFSGRLRYALDGGANGKTEALVLMCPRTSRGLDDEARVLEAAALDPSGAAEAFRIGVHALAGDWRDDPSVTVRPCRGARIWASGQIPALIDGELVRLTAGAQARFRPQVARVLAPAKARP